MNTEKFQAVNKDSRVPAKLEDLVNSIQRNCTISDARFSGFYSLCILILRLRNLYKWEKGLEPWSEPDTPVLMEWVDAREKLWESLLDEPFQSLDYNGQVVDPLEGSAVNQWFSGSGLLYGAGYGRSLKPVFFLADKKEEREVEGIPLFILGKEQARELAAPFAMNQEEIIYIRREPLRFHLWDQIQEIRYTGKKTLLPALKFYQVLNKDGKIDQSRLIHNFDRMTDTELETFVYHEIGEVKEDMITSSVSRQIINAFPHSPIEFLSRAVRDLLADTNRSGLLSYIVAERKETSLSFYVASLDGLRALLFPEITAAYDKFLKDGDWRLISRAAAACRESLKQLAGKLIHVTELLADKPRHEVEGYVEQEVLVPLGLGRQES